MTTISNSTASQLAASQLVTTQRTPSHAPSEQGRIASAISSGVADGSISSSDAKALTSAADSIDKSLASDASGGTGASGPRLDPSKARERIDGLIADQVGNGTLTRDQASELKGLFARGGKAGSDKAGFDKSGSDGAGAASGRGGPPPGPPPAAAASGGSTGAGGSTASSASDLLASFIQQLQTAPTSGYAVSQAGGASGTGTRASAALFDFET